MRPLYKGDACERERIYGENPFSSFSGMEGRGTGFGSGASVGSGIGVASGIGVVFNSFFNSCSADQQATIGIDFFSKTISNLQQKARELKYKQRLEKMESKTMKMLITTGLGVMVLLIFAVLMLMNM